MWLQMVCCVILSEALVCFERMNAYHNIMLGIGCVCMRMLNKCGYLANLKFYPKSVANAFICIAITFSTLQFVFVALCRMRINCSLRILQQKYCNDINACVCVCSAFFSLSFPVKCYFRRLKFDLQKPLNFCSLTWSHFSASIIVRSSSYRINIHALTQGSKIYTTQHFDSRKTSSRRAREMR